MTHQPIEVDEVFIPFLSEFHPDFQEAGLNKFILNNINVELQSAKHGSEISGRPGTLITLTNSHVIKLRSELEIDLIDCYDFLHDTISSEINLGIYHPDKTWFYLLLNTGKTLIGNITPRLVSLENLDNEYEENLYQQICKSLTLYFKCLANKHVRLDLSLSNFALKPGQPELYYLDDETYLSDDFTQLSDYLSFLIRSGSITEENTLKNLGRFIYKQLDTYYAHNSYNIPIIQTLKNSFLAPDKYAAMLALTSSMYDTQAVQLETRNSRRMAIIADIHANAPALVKVLEFIDENGIDDILVLGDIVGYGPHPNECVEILQQKKGIQIICGNHDHAAYVKDGIKNNGITSHANWALNWTRGAIDTDAAQWLAQLPMYIQDPDWLAVHGAPVDKNYFNAYVYQMSYSSNLDALTQRNIPICFHGHTHIQKIYYRLKGEDFESSKNVISIKHHQHSLICPGSVGQPRCGIPGAELALIDFSDYTVHFHRLEYDIHKTLSDMKTAGFPSVLVERLEQGY